MKKLYTAIISIVLLGSSRGVFADDMSCDPDWGFIDQVICRAVLVPVIVIGGAVNVLRPVGNAFSNIFPDAYYSVNVSLDDNPAVPADLSFTCGKAIQASPKHTVRISCNNAPVVKGGHSCVLSDPFDNLGHGFVTTPIFVSKEGVPDVRCLKLKIDGLKVEKSNKPLVPEISPQPTAPVLPSKGEEMQRPQIPDRGAKMSAIS